MLYCGKSLEEAIKTASEAENTPSEELTYYLVSEDEGNVQIEVYTIVDVIEFAKDYITNGIEAMGFDVRVYPTLKDDIINLKIESDHNPILIGRNGVSLQSLNELVRIAVFQHFHERYRVLLNVSDYKEEKYVKITSIARRVAHEVQRTKVNATLDPMTADERRAVHNALSGMPNIKTESTGFGRERQINIVYVEKSEEKTEEE